MKQKYFELGQFEGLREALIDASSIIYCSKAGFFDKLQASLRLYTLPEMLDEARIKREWLRIQLVHCAQDNLSNDHKLITCALNSRLPVISEDKQILMSIKRAGLPYYNALMMLDWLLFKEDISHKQYLSHLSELHHIARYSQFVWEYGQYVYFLILQYQNKTRLT